MRAHLPVLLAALLVSSHLPAQRMSMRLVTSHDSVDGCTTVASPLLSRTSGARHRSTFSLDVFAEYADSAAAQALDAVVVGAAVLQDARDPDPFGATPTLSLRIDGGRSRTYRSRFGGHLRYSRSAPDRAVYTAYFRIPRADLDRIAAARAVTGTVGRQAFTFGAEQLATIRELAAWAGRSPQAPLPRPGQTQGVDCITYETIVQ